MENITDSDYHLIERFFERELTETELTTFEQRLATDTRFEQQVAQYEFALRTVTDIYLPEQGAVKKALSHHWKKPSAKTRKLLPKMTFWKRIASVAASILMFLGVGWWWQQAMEEPQNLAILFAQKTDNLESFDHDNRGQSNIPEILSFYRDENYQAVISMTNQTDNLVFDEKLLRARAFIKMKQYKEAIPILENLYTQKEAKQDEIIWNLAFAHFANGEKKDALQYLNQIAEGHFGEKDSKEAKNMQQLF